MNNDLISRSALIKEVNENKELFESERVYLEGLLLNAPTVESYTEEDMKLTIKENFDIGYEMAKNKYERPQGEWVKNEHTFWTCSHCNWFNDVNRIKYNFCPNCGACMQKGGAE